MLLNVGTGPNPAPAPWVNLDCERSDGVSVLADAGRLPFADCAADRILACHICEHLPLDALPSVLAEWRRVLRPAGTLCIVGPDVDRAVTTRQPWWLLDAIVAHGEGPGAHRWTCSEAVLLDVLHRCGWEAEPVDVATVTPPTWPSPSTASWQLAVFAR